MFENSSVTSAPWLQTQARRKSILLDAAPVDHLPNAMTENIPAMFACLDE
jgi:hypothetical protein